MTTKPTITPLTPQSEDFPRWYQDVIAKAELAENGPVRGTMVIRPYAFAIWERIQAMCDQLIKEAGAENAYFPLFIPENFLQREAEHVDGFSPELAVVTHGGGKELEEPIVVRPTSETIINHYFSKWIQSHRDLPLLINQWCNVVRWELRPRLFLRTTEFLWQEGHTAHVSEQDAHEYALGILHNVYTKTLTELLAIPVIVGRKSNDERFAGASVTWTCEAMMRDGKALQMATSHELGQNFAKAFDIQYLSTTGQREYVWQTSWGLSTRVIGGLIMTHGDDKGLRVPPAVAPIQVVVMVVRDGEGTREKAASLVADLRRHGLRVQLDGDVERSFGWRATDWEIKGVPVRVELGPRELESGSATVVRRDTNEKEPVGLDNLVAHISQTLTHVQYALYAEAERKQQRATIEATNLEAAIEAASTGFATIAWDAIRSDGDARALAQAGLTVRCLQREDGSLPASESESGLRAYISRAY